MAPKHSTPAGPGSTLADYLDTRDRATRLKALQRLRDAGEHLPIALAEDLLCLDLSPDEKVAVVESTGSKDGRALEHFLTAQLLNWPQDLAAAAVRHWAARTDHLLWFRVLEACRSPHVSQRVFYTIVDLAFRTGGARVLDVAAGAEGFEEMSPAFHGLLLHRAVQWNFRHQRLDVLAERTLGELARVLHPENKAMPSALAYVARFAPDHVRTLARRSGGSAPWRDHLKTLVLQLDQEDKETERLTKLAAKPATGKKALEQLDGAWPALWSRHRLTKEHVAFAFKAEGPKDDLIERLGGVTPDALAAGLALEPDDARFATATASTLGYFSFPTADALLTLVKERLAKAQDPAALLAHLPLRLRVEMTNDAASQARSPYALVKQEEAASLASRAPERVVFADYQRDDAATDAALPTRKAYFDAAYRNETPKADAKKADPFFGLLLDAWQAPAEAKIAPLAQAARSVAGPFRLAYVHTLGRFKGHDQAALKLLDFIRSKEEDDLRAVIQALGGIGTARAAQELVATLTRPNMTPALQLDACAILAKMDTANLQSELRSAIKDLSNTYGDGSTGLEVKDAIASLLAPLPAAAPTKDTRGGKPAVSGTAAPTGASAVSDQQLDHALSGKIQHYRELSSEVKRALRTSQFFHMQVTGASAPESIDLSPVIDMQYKALELLFRETFEELCSRVISKGVLQRRLDVIGYARPIPRAMDEFEAYLAQLPTVRDIPFFSKFKLRKMLRAICQFRPGKRFTLDGLKAFALFFLCFGRSECRYGLQGLFPLGLPSDKELAEFAKALHIFQDFRNRAAHEGFHPDASSDIDGIWRQTAEIVQTMYKVKAFVEGAVESEYAPKNRSTPVIEKKVS